MAEHASHSAHPISSDAFRLSEATFAKVRTILMGAAAVGWLLLIAGYFADHERFFRSYLLNYVYCLTFVIGALFFVMVQHLSGATWSVVIRRIAESLMMVIPVAFLLFLPIVLDLHALYEWTHTEVVAKDPILLKKEPYLNVPFFLIRTVIYFAIWSFFAFKLWGWSTAQDSNRDFSYTEKSRKLSAFGVFLLTVTFSLAAMDWVMSLMPHWFSTMFGVYMYAGAAMAFTAFMILIGLAFRSNGILDKAISEEHYHDLGKWLFAFNTFWAYCAFSQYMLIWYGNLTEETIFFQHRFQGSWEIVSKLLIFGHFLFPFAILVARWAKRNLTVLAFMAGWLLLMHYVDIYWLIMGSLYKEGVPFHWLDVAGLLALAPTFGLIFWMRLAKQNIVPVGDLRFERSLNFHQV
jgi:hypothetical protein